MILALPIPIIIFAMVLIMASIVLPNLIMFCMIMQRDIEQMPRARPTRMTPYHPEYMERMYYDPAAEIYFIPRLK